MVNCLLNHFTGTAPLNPKTRLGYDMKIMEKLGINIKKLISGKLDYFSHFSSIELSHRDSSLGYTYCI